MNIKEIYFNNDVAEYMISKKIGKDTEVKKAHDKFYEFIEKCDKELELRIEEIVNEYLVAVREKAFELGFAEGQNLMKAILNDWWDSKEWELSRETHACKWFEQNMKGGKVDE